MSKRVIQFQRAQLAAVSGVHFVADLFSNVLPPILPAVRRHFGLSLFEGSVLVVVLLLACNWFQLAAGHLRSRKNDRIFLYGGLVLAASVSWVGLVPTWPQALWILGGLAVVTGLGIAMVHPDSLRIHTLDRITPASTTAVFMAAGFAGFACSGWISTALVARWGLKGLYPLAVCPLVVILAVKALRVRLAVESEDGRDKFRSAPPANHPLFWSLMVLSVPSAISTTVVGTLLPTHLVDELHFNLTFGGLSATVYGLGGALGSILWAGLARRKGELVCMIWALFLVIPFLGLYLVFMSSKVAILLLLGVGFFSFSAYILMVTLARKASGMSLSMRMALIVGGTWGVANLVFLPLAHLAEITSTGLVLSLAPVGYLGAAVWGIGVWRRGIVSGQSIRGPGA